MKLVILGKEPIEQLEQWAIQLFSDIKNKEKQLPSWGEVKVRGISKVSQIFQHHYFLLNLQIFSTFYSGYFRGYHQLFSSHLLKNN